MRVQAKFFSLRPSCRAGQHRSTSAPHRQAAGHLPPLHTLLLFALKKKERKKRKLLGVNLVVVKFKEASAELGGISLSTK